jgi:hypothetical protein
MIIAVEFFKYIDPAIGYPQMVIFEQLFIITILHPFAEFIDSQKRKI